MPLIINTGLTTNEGFSVPSGSYLNFQTIFPDGRKEIHYNLKPFKSETDYNNGKGFFNPQEFNIGVVKKLSDSEYTGLTTTKVHEFLQEEIENKVGSGTTEIKI